MTTNNNNPSPPTTSLPISIAARKSIRFNSSTSQEKQQHNSAPSSPTHSSLPSARTSSDRRRAYTVHHGNNNNNNNNNNNQTGETTVLEIKNEMFNNSMNGGGGGDGSRLISVLNCSQVIDDSCLFMYRYLSKPFAENCTLKKQSHNKAIITEDQVLESTEDLKCNNINHNNNNINNNNNNTSTTNSDSQSSTDESNNNNNTHSSSTTTEQQVSETTTTTTTTTITTEPVVEESLSLSEKLLRERVVQLERELREERETREELASMWKSQREENQLLNDQITKLKHELDYYKLCGEMAESPTPTPRTPRTPFGPLLSSSTSSTSSISTTTASAASSATATATTTTNANGDTLVVDTLSNNNNNNNSGEDDGLTTPLSASPTTKNNNTNRPTTRNHRHSRSGSVIRSQLFNAIAHSNNNNNNSNDSTTTTTTSLTPRIHTANTNRFRDLTPTHLRRQPDFDNDLIASPSTPGSSRGSLIIESSSSNTTTATTSDATVEQGEETIVASQQQQQQQPSSSLNQGTNSSSSGVVRGKVVIPPLMHSLLPPPVPPTKPILTPRLTALSLSSPSSSAPSSPLPSSSFSAPSSPLASPRSRNRSHRNNSSNANSNNNMMTTTATSGGEDDRTMIMNHLKQQDDNILNILSREFNQGSMCALTGATTTTTTTNATAPSAVLPSVVGAASSGVTPVMSDTNSEIISAIHSAISTELNHQLNTASSASTSTTHKHHNNRSSTHVNNSNNRSMANGNILNKGVTAATATTTPNMPTTSTAESMTENDVAEDVYSDDDDVLGEEDDKYDDDDDTMVDHEYNEEDMGDEDHPSLTSSSLSSSSITSPLSSRTAATNTTTATTNMMPMTDNPSLLKHYAVLNRCVQLFNSHPSRGPIQALDYLNQHYEYSSSSNNTSGDGSGAGLSAGALFLARLQSLNKITLGTFLTLEKNESLLNDFSMAAMSDPLFRNKGFEYCLRNFFMLFKLPIEGQYVTRAATAFANAYTKIVSEKQQNSPIGTDPDQCLLLVCGLFMVNSAHKNPKAVPSMSKAQFLSMFPESSMDHQYLGELYDNIRKRAMVLDYQAPPSNTTASSTSQVDTVDDPTGSDSLAIKRPFEFEWHRSVVTSDTTDLTPVIIRDIYPKCQLLSNGTVLDSTPNTPRIELSDGILYNRSVLRHVIESKFYLITYNVHDLRSFYIAQHILHLISYYRRVYESEVLSASDAQLLQQLYESNNSSSSSSSSGNNSDSISNAILDASYMTHDSHLMRYTPYIHNPIFLIGLYNKNLPLSARQVPNRQGVQLALASSVSFYECELNDHEQIEHVMNEAYRELYRMEFVNPDDHGNYYSAGASNETNNNISVSPSTTMHTPSSATSGSTLYSASTPSSVGSSSASTPTSATSATSSTHSQGSSTKYILDGKKISLDELLNMPKLYF